MLRAYLSMNSSSRTRPQERDYLSHLVDAFCVKNMWHILVKQVFAQKHVNISGMFESTHIQPAPPPHTETAKFTSTVQPERLFCHETWIFTLIIFHVQRQLWHTQSIKDHNLWYQRAISIDEIMLLTKYCQSHLSQCWRSLNFWHGRVSCFASSFLNDICKCFHVAFPHHKGRDSLMWKWCIHRYREMSLTSTPPLLVLEVV